MKKFMKIEDGINRILSNVGEQASSATKKITPKKILESVVDFQENFAEKKVLLGKGLVEKKNKAQSDLINLKKKSTKNWHKTKDSALNSLVEAKDFRLTPSILKKIVLAIFAIFAPPLKKCTHWVFTLKPKALVAFVTLSTVGSLTGITVYKNSKKIAEKAARSPAAEMVEKVKDADGTSRRPAYFRRTDKEFLVRNFIFPVHLVNTGGMKVLNLDFTVKASNKYIRAYLWENPYLITNKLHSTIETMSIEFPVESQEGKQIIKDKIKVELNALLKELEIKGEIDEINIHSMLGA